jgi:hypothetical protein
LSRRSFFFSSFTAERAARLSLRLQMTRRKGGGGRAEAGQQVQVHGHKHV